MIKFSVSETTKTKSIQDEEIAGENVAPSQIANKKFAKSKSTFKDGTRSIDFVLVYKNDASLEKSEKRRIFQSNLKKVGLELEEDEPVPGLRLRFVKIHAPKNVCREYCEKLKLRMPTKKLRNKLEETTINCSPSNAWNLCNTVRRWVSRKTDYDHQLFPSTQQYQMAVYRRDEEDIFDVNAANFFTPTIRATIVQFILDRTSFSPNDIEAYDFGIHQAYCDAYPLHEGDCDIPGTPRYVLTRGWASLRNTFRYQPLDHIREYFGTEIALYFTWLGFYTFMLLLPAILGSMCSLYTWSRSGDCSECESRFTTFFDMYQGQMEEWSEFQCTLWGVQGTCLDHPLQSILPFEDFIIIFYTIFMCIWCAAFLELWKQYFAEMTRKWDVTEFNKHEERPRPEYLAMLRYHRKKMVHPITNETEPKISFWTQGLPSKLLAVICTTILICISFIGAGITDWFILFLEEKFRNLRTDWIVFIITPSVAPIILNLMYTRLARHFTNMGLHRTQIEYDNTLMRKLYLFHSVNYYWPQFYTVFLQAKPFIGWPRNVLNNQIYSILTRPDHKICGLDGCLTDLRAQLTSIMIGKQAINALTEYTRPIIGCWRSGYKIKKAKRRKNVWNLPPSLELKHWMNEYKLLPFQSPPMYHEYLEMVVQFGFVMLFAHAFPLAPLFALLNNVVEVRLDAKKMITFHRRPVPQVLAKHFNIWFKILDSIGNLAIFTNSFIIAFVSDVIPRMVYKYVLKYRNDDNPDRYHGYLLFSLSYANLLDRYDLLISPSEFREDMTDADITALSKLDGKYIDFWICLFARLLFMVLFQKFVTLLANLVRQYIRSRNVFCGSTVPTRAEGIPTQEQKTHLSNDVNQYDKREKQPRSVIETQV